METVIFAVAVGMAVIFVFIAVAIRGDPVQRSRWIREFSEKWGCRVAWDVGPRVTVDRPGFKTSIEVAAFRGPGVPGFQMRLSWTDPCPGAFCINTRGMLPGIAALFGERELPTGDVEFDSFYAVRGEFARKVLIPDVLRKLRILGRRGGIHLTCSPRGMQFQAMGEPFGDEELRRWFVDFAETGLAIAMAVQDEPEVVGFQVSGAVCPVCGTVLAGVTATCESCRTPHHVDCWNFIGRCSTYACGSVRVFKS